MIRNELPIIKRTKGTRVQKEFSPVRVDQFERQGLQLKLDMCSRENPFLKYKLSDQFNLYIADTEDRRRRARILAHEVYVNAGYAKRERSEECSGLLINDDPALSFEILICTASGKAAATVSLVFDSPCGLPCDRVFKENLDGVKKDDQSLVEVTRLAIAPEFMHSKQLILRLFNFIYIYARLMRRADGFVVEVNPRHMNYYHRLLGFEQLGGERPCPRVQGAPACLLFLDLAYSEQQVKQTRKNLDRAPSTNKRTLYPYFYGSEEEQRAIHFIRQHTER